MLVTVKIETIKKEAGKRVSSQHLLARLPPKWLDGRAVDWWLNFARLDCIGLPNTATVVWDETTATMAGFFRYRVYDTPGGERRLKMLGTWVHPDYRGRGIATMLWTEAFNGVDRISAVTLNPTSRHLLEKVVAKFPGLMVSHWTWRRRRNRLGNLKWKLVKEKKNGRQAD